MPFDQSTMVGQPTLRQVGRDFVVTWISTSPDGTLFQIYINSVLAWHGTDRRAVFPLPLAKVTVQVGTVLPGEGGIDFSASLPGTDAEPPDRVQLKWTGGTFEGMDLDHFLVYQSALPLLPPSYVQPVATIPAAVAGVVEPSQTYTWTSGKLSSGLWSFAVVAVDVAGNLTGTRMLASATIIAAPAPAAPFPDGSRLKYRYDTVTRVPTLYWNASPY